MSAPNPECPGCQALQQRVAELEARLALLEARLAQNSSNSSRPPSSDPPFAPRRVPTSTPSGRKQGGQPGHKGSARPLKPIEEVDELFAQIPLVCSHCSARLPLVLDPSDPPPQRHQLLDLAPKLILTTEYQLDTRSCPCCGGHTSAPLPPGVPHGIVAPRLQAFLALMTGRFRLSRRGVQELFSTVFDEELALGTISILEGRTATALSAPYEAAQAYVATAGSVNVDETPWLDGNQRSWMWTAVTPPVVCYRIDPSRSRAAFERLVPPLAEGEERTVTSDRYSVYTHLVGEGWQICWAHLKRDFTALSQMKEAEPKLIGERALGEIETLFGLWHAYRGGELDRAGLAEGMRPVQERFSALLAQAEGSGHWKAAPLGWHLLGQFASLWTFVVREGVEPTNNAAERAVRPAVLMRKSSFGTRSEAGRGFVERMLTVVGSLKAQGREVMAYLEAAIRAAAVGADAPSLVPEASS